MRMSDLECRAPRWSPNGDWIAFAGRHEGIEAIYLAKPDGSGLKQLTAGKPEEAEPAWSPDGKRLAYVASGEQGSTVMVIGPVDGAEMLGYAVPSREVSATSPAWSPDGERIALVMERDGVRGVCVVSVQGGELTAVGAGPGNSLSPAWSPDGEQIAFANDRGGTYRPFVMNADGSDERMLADVVAVAPRWSPDGKTIAYQGTIEPRSPRGPKPVGVCLLNVADGSAKALQSAAMGQAPDWSPDGSQIVFSRNYRLWLLNVARDEATEVSSL